MATLLEDSTNLYLDIVQNQKIPSSEYNIVFMGDSWFSPGVGAGQSPQRELANPSTTGSEILHVAMTEAKKYNPLCIIHGGDAVFNGTEEQLTSFKTAVQAYAGDTPVFVTIGNHDVYDNQNKKYFVDNYKKIIGDLRYAINVANDPYHLTFISLNNVWPTLRTLLPDEISFLNNTLQNAHRNCFVSIHIPPKTDKWKDGMEDKNGKDELYKSLKGGKVRKLLVSHRHEIDTDAGEGVEFILSGAAGAPLFIGQTFAIVVFTIKNIPDSVSSVISYKVVPIGWTA
ncbi:metallophosphoesterase family protein [Acetivibrio cellulolyticus]|uniref:metallophosphoesterase family protein n=1 Tax=Acetivibrio cellulolyticus TaxID=35830 RepID=UPI0001E2F58A|nr:metallophosphoesterase [Acetivibrio cellulolyticus]